MAGNSSLCCCSIVISSDISSEKCEPSIEDSCVAQDCELRSDFAGPRMAIMHYISSQTSTRNSDAAPGWISESTGAAQLSIRFGEDLRKLWLAMSSIFRNAF